jgi:hypothetical protein
MMPDQQPLRGSSYQTAEAAIAASQTSDLCQLG